jgi:hypothetical protein
MQWAGPLVGQLPAVHSAATHEPPRPVVGRQKERNTLMVLG